MANGGRRPPRPLQLAAAWLLAALALSAAPATALDYYPRAPRARSPGAAQRGSGAAMSAERPAAPPPAEVAGKLGMKRILDWAGTEPHLASIRRSAVEQFIAQYATARAIVTGGGAAGMATAAGGAGAGGGSLGTLTWGDELEYALMAFASDDEIPGCRGEGVSGGACNALRLALSAADVIPRLEAAEARAAEAAEAAAPASDAVAEASSGPPAPGAESASERAERVEWHPEYGGWMVEATPAQPYGGSEAQLWRVRRAHLLFCWCVGVLLS